MEEGNQCNHGQDFQLPIIVPHTEVKDGPGLIHMMEFDHHRLRRLAVSRHELLDMHTELLVLGIDLVEQAQRQT